MTAIVKAMAHCCHTAFVGVGLNPIADTQLVAKMTRMYGPAVRCKRNRRGWRNLVSRQCIRPLGGAHMAPGHHGGKACDLINRQASMGLRGSPVLACAGKTVAPFLPFSLADLGGKLGLTPTCSWSFLFLVFLLFDRAAGFLPSRPRQGEPAPSRCCQGWLPLAATVRLGLDRIEHDGTLTRSGPSSGGLGGCF